MAEETKYDVVNDIVQVTVSIDTKVSDGNYGSKGEFLSATAIVPRHGDPDKIIESLKAWVKDHMGNGKVEEKKEVTLEQKDEQKKDGPTAPICSTHYMPMKPSKYPKPGSNWYCPYKDNKDKFCKETSN